MEEDREAEKELEEVFSEYNEWRREQTESPEKTFFSGEYKGYRGTLYVNCLRSFSLYDSTGRRVYHASMQAGKYTQEDFEEILVEAVGIAERAKQMKESGEF